jgi:hypothetical protein
LVLALELAVVLAGLGSFAAAPSVAQVERDLLVVLLRPVPTNELLAEAIVRIKSELQAGGFQVAESTCPASTLLPEPRVLMERAAEGKPPSATPAITLAIFGDLSKGAAELWVVDGTTGKAGVRRVQVTTSPDRPLSEVLAIRAQELMRAMLVEVPVEEKKPATPAVATVAPAAGTSAGQAQSPWRVGLELGGSAFGGWGDIGPMVAPVARLSLAIDEGFWLRLTGLGFGSQPRVQAHIGAATASASVRQDVILLEGAAWFRPRSLARPVLSLGLGTLRFGVDGTAGTPYQGEHNARWYLAADVGAGLAVRLGAHWQAQLDVHALLAAPRPTVQFFDVAAKSAGQPTLLAVFTLAGGT